MAHDSKRRVSYQDTLFVIALFWSIFLRNDTLIFHFLDTVASWKNRRQIAYEGGLPKWYSGITYFMDGRSHSQHHS